MENAKTIAEEAAHLAEAVSEQGMATLDFDRLRECLTQVAALARAATLANAELAVLRADYTARMAGLIKAIAVAQKRPDALAAALQRIEGLSDLAATQLVEEYRRTNVRFRDTFGGSRGLSWRGARRHRRIDCSSFK